MSSRSPSPRPSGPQPGGGRSGPAGRRKIWLTRRRVRNETWVVGPCRGTRRRRHPSPALRRPRGRPRGPRPPARPHRGHRGRRHAPPTAREAIAAALERAPRRRAHGPRDAERRRDRRDAPDRRRGARGANVVVLTSFSDNTRIHDALDAGALGYLLKDAEASRGRPRDPRRRRAASRRSTRASPAPVLARGTTPAALSGMTAREREVLVLLGTGLPNKVDRAPPGHQRGDREGAPHPDLPPDRRHRPHPGRDLGPRAPRRGGVGAGVAQRRRPGALDGHAGVRKPRLRADNPTEHHPACAGPAPRERTTGLEPATPSLGSWCSTN